MWAASLSLVLKGDTQGFGHCVEEIGLVGDAEDTLGIGALGGYADLDTGVFLAFAGEVGGVGNFHLAAFYGYEGSGDARAVSTQRDYLAGLSVIGGNNDEGIGVGGGVVEANLDGAVEGYGFADLAAGVSGMVALVDGRAFYLEEETLLMGTAGRKLQQLDGFLGHVG